MSILYLYFACLDFIFVVFDFLFYLLSTVLSNRKEYLLLTVHNVLVWALAKGVGLAWYTYSHHLARSVNVGRIGAG